MQRKIITTKDNSKTLLISDLNETYHSNHGALTEAQHIFIKNGVNQLKDKQKEEISIFEMGFGTGLNAILTFQFAQQHQLKINYTTIEKYPILQSEIESLNYATLLNLSHSEKETYQKMHLSKPDQTKTISPYFEFKLFKNDIKHTELNQNTFDIIYYDAFAPQHQPQLWEESVLKKMYDSLTPDGFLITYCAQGQFKRTLKEIGFEVKPLPGPPGKREITKAIKK